MCLRAIVPPAESGPGNPGRSAQSQRKGAFAVTEYFRADAENVIPTGHRDGDLTVEGVDHFGGETTSYVDGSQVGIRQGPTT